MFTIQQEMMARNKMLLPLTEMMHYLREFKENFPTLTSLPKRLLQAEQRLDELTSSVRHEFITLD
jgi:hypothetical protein